MADHVCCGICYRTGLWEAADACGCETPNMFAPIPPTSSKRERLRLSRRHANFGASCSTSSWQTRVGRQGAGSGELASLLRAENRSEQLQSASEVLTAGSCLVAGMIVNGLTVDHGGRCRGQFADPDDQDLELQDPRVIFRVILEW